MRTDVTVFLSRTTASRRMFFTPMPEMDRRIHGALARAQRRHPLAIHGFTFLGNRVDLLVTAPSRERITGFLQYLYGQLAKAVSEVHGWTDRIFSCRTRRWEVLDAVAARDRLRDVHAMAVWRGWIARPEEWPGVSSAGALLDGRYLGVPLEPIPVALGGAVAIEPLFEEIAASGRRVRNGRPVLGRDWILDADPLRPDPTDPFYGTQWEREELAATAGVRSPLQQRLLN